MTTRQPITDSRRRGALLSAALVVAALGVSSGQADDCKLHREPDRTIASVGSSLPPPPVTHSGRERPKLAGGDIAPPPWQLWWIRTGVAHTNQPPPPALRPYFGSFLPLYISYNAVPASTHKPSFSQWLIMHRVVDPTTHQAMLLLYFWAERLPRPLV